MAGLRIVCVTVVKLAMVCPNPIQCFDFSDNSLQLVFFEAVLIKTEQGQTSWRAVEIGQWYEGRWHSPF